MQQKENEVSSDALAERYACDRGIEEFKKWYPSGSAPISEVLRKLQELANTSTDYGEYVEYAKWLIRHFPPTQELLVLNELTGKVIFHNGDIDIYSDVDGEYTFISNGNLNIKGNVKLTGDAEIYAKNVIAKNKTIELDVKAQIVAETIDAQNIAAKGNAEIWAETVDTINIAAKDYAEIWADEINTQNIMDDDGKRIRGDINLIQPSSNQQNTSTAS